MKKQLLTLGLLLSLTNPLYAGKLEKQINCKSFKEIAEAYSLLAKTRNFFNDSKEREFYLKKAKESLKKYKKK